MSYWYTQGTIAVENGSKVVTGTDVSWESTVKSGDTIMIGVGRVPYTIAAVPEVDELELVSEYAGSSDSGLSYEIQRGIGWLFGSAVAEMTIDALGRMVGAGTVRKVESTPAPTFGSNNDLAVLAGPPLIAWHKQDGAWIDVTARLSRSVEPVEDTDYTVTAADNGRMIAMLGLSTQRTVTLPPGDDVWNGFSVVVKLVAGTADAVVATSVGDAFGDGGNQVVMSLTGEFLAVRYAGNGAWYVEGASGAAAGAALIAVKAPCRLATTANKNLTTGGLAAIDGVTPSAGDRILVRAQSTASQNGIYIAASGAWVRADDASATGDLRRGTRVLVLDGTTYGTREFMVTANDPITIGSTAITFGFVQDAAQAVIDAEAARDKAAEWADKAEDSTVETGPNRYSALHWAAKAEDHAASASGSATAAAGSATTAAGHKDAAEAAETAAEAARDKAAEWAEEDEDQEVETGLYSAKHHAAKASAAQTGAEDARDLAAAWANEDEDEEVETGLYSAKHWAAKAEAAVDTAAIEAAAASAIDDKVALAEAWADEAEDTPVDTDPDRFSAKHHAAKAAASLAAVEALVDEEALEGAIEAASATVLAKAADWADKAEDEPVEEDPDRFSALHHAAKAEGFADAAATSATAASGSADTATASAISAGESETRAEAWADEDEDVPVEEDPDRFSAKHHAAKAAASETAAESARDKAAEWADKAEDSPVEEGPDRFSALHHAAKAEASADLAARWAGEDEDVEVESGLYSARHWAAKAQSIVLDDVDATVITAEPHGAFVGENVQAQLEEIGTVAAGLTASKADNYVGIDLKSNDNHDILSSDHRKVVSFPLTTTNRTATLPDSTTVGAGFTVTVKLRSTTTAHLTIVRAGSDTFDDGGTSLRLSTAGDVVTLVSDGAGVWEVARRSIRPLRHFHTSSGTHTFTPGCRWFELILVGGGGGGGGIAGGTGESSGGGGGGGAILASRRRPASMASATVTIGAAGAAGSASGGNGGAGGNTVWADGTNTFTAPGGGGGTGDDGSAPSVGKQPGAGGNPSGGDLNLIGQMGGLGVPGTNYAGQGGSPGYGLGVGAPVRAAVNAAGGDPGRGRGAGGAGSIRIGGSGGIAGGAGTAGIVLLVEFF